MKTKYIFLLISLIYSISFAFWTNWQDAYFWYNSTKFYQESFMCVATLWIGHVWLSITGDNALHLQILAWLISMFSIIYPYLKLQNKKQWIENLNFLSVGILLMGNWTWGMYCNDTTTLLFISIISTNILSKRDNSFGDLLFLGIISAFAVASRIPNVVAIPIVMSYWVVSGYLNKSPRHIILQKCGKYLLFSSVSYVILIMLMTRKVDIITLALNSGQETQNHVIGTIIGTYIQSVVNIFYSIIFVWGFIYFVKFCGYSDKSHYVWKILILGLSILLFHHIYYYWQYASSAFTVILFYLLAKKNGGEKSLALLLTFVFLSLGLTCPLGSDTGLCKATAYFSCFVPIVLIGNRKYIRESFTAKVGVFLCICFSVYNYNCTTWDTTAKSDINVTTLDFNKKIDNIHYCGYVTTQEYNALQKQLNLYEKYGCKDHSIFIGFNRAHAMYMLTDSKPYGYVTFWMKGEYENNIIDTFMSDEKSVLFDYKNRVSISQKMKEKNILPVYSDESVSIYKHNK